jgi:hypothetical protein
MAAKLTLTVVAVLWLWSLLYDIARLTGGAP